MSERNDRKPDQGAQEASASRWAHYLDGQYTPERAVLYKQAAELAGLSVSTVDEGKVFSDRNLKVGKGYVGVKVWIYTGDVLAK